MHYDASEVNRFTIQLPKHLILSVLAKCTIPITTSYRTASRKITFSGIIIFWGIIELS
jgi:hypothetical protein